MIEIILKSNTGFSRTIQAPSSLSELPLPRYVDFLVEQRKIGYDVNNVEIMAKAVEAFYKIPMDEILSQTSGNLYGKDIKGLEGSLRGLYSYASKMVADGLGRIPNETDSFQYKGETYVMPVILKQALAGELILPDVQTIEAIEAAEIQRHTSQQIEAVGDPVGSLKRKIMELVTEHAETHGADPGLVKEANQIIEAETEKLGDSDGTLRCTEFLKMCAIMYKKEGEHLPVNDGDREKWINDRAIHFWELDAQTCLNVSFFFRSISPRLEGTKDMFGFLREESSKVLAEILSLKWLLSIERRLTTKRSLVELGGEG